MVHAWQENDLCQWLASDGAEIGSEVFRLLHTIDFVTCRASQLYDQLSTVSNLLRAGRIQMNARAVV